MGGWVQCSPFEDMLKQPRDNPSEPCELKCIARFIQFVSQPTASNREKRSLFRVRSWDGFMLITVFLAVCIAIGVFFIVLVHGTLAVYCLASTKVAAT